MWIFLWFLPSSVTETERFWSEDKKRHLLSLCADISHFHSFWIILWIKHIITKKCSSHVCLRLSLGVQKHTFKSIDGCIAPGSEFVQQTPTTSLRSNTLNCSMEWWHWTAGKTREHSYRLIFDTFVIGSRCPFKQHILQFEPLSPNYPKLCFLDQLINHCVYWLCLRWAGTGPFTNQAVVGRPLD